MEIVLSDISVGNFKKLNMCIFDAKVTTIIGDNASGKSIGIGQLSTAGANERKCEIGTDSTHIKNNLYIHDVKVLWYE